MGLSARKIAVGRALARRLQTYRLLDAPALMLSTYKALQGGQASEQLSMEVCLRKYSRSKYSRSKYSHST